MLTRYRLILLLAFAITTGCGSDVTLQQQPRAGDGVAPIPRLSAPTSARVRGVQAQVDEEPWPSLASSFRLDMSCAAVSEYLKIELRFIREPPAGAGAPICFIDAFGPQALPQDVASGQWFAHVLYVPAGMSVTESSYRDVLNAGGIDVALTPSSGRPAAQARGASKPDASGGGYYYANVRGVPAVVQRVRDNRVVTRWQEPPEGGGGTDGLDIELSADYSEQELFNWAHALERGSPPNAQPPLEKLPPAEPQGEGAPDGASTAPAEAPMSAPGER